VHTLKINVVADHSARRLTTTIAESATAATEEGLGLAQITSYQAEHGIRAGTLQLVLRDYECAPTPVSLVHASQRMVPLKLRALLDYTVPRLAERLSAIAAVLD
jgi:DNA-binding transcriptional LysR family regulator